MSWYSSVLKEIDGYNDHWRSKLVESWTETDVFNWIASSSRLTLVPVEELPFEQFRHISGKQLVKWKVSNFVHKDAKNGVFLYLYLQDIIAHHKGKACRNDLVPAVVGITSQLEPLVKEELQASGVRVSDVPILHTNTWRKKNLSDWTGLDVYHWLLHLCKEHSIPLDKFPFTEFEDFDGMRLLLLSGNDYAKKSLDYGIFIYQSVNQLILHYSDSVISSPSLTCDHTEDEFATIFTCTSNTSVISQPPDYTSSGNYYLNPAPPYSDFSHSTNPLLNNAHSYTTLQDIKPEITEENFPPPYSLYSSEYMHQQHQPSPVNHSQFGYLPPAGYCTGSYHNYHERSMDPDSQDRRRSMTPYTLPVKEETPSQYSIDQYSSTFPSPSHHSHRRKPPPAHPSSRHSDMSLQYSYQSTLHSGEFQDASSAIKTDRHYPPGHGNDLNTPSQDAKDSRSKNLSDAGTSKSIEMKSPAKKKSTSTQEKKGKHFSEISKAGGIPYSVLTAYNDKTKITIKFADPGTPSWRRKQVKHWKNDDVRAWCRTIAPDIGLPATKFPHHLFPADLDGPKLLEMKKSDFIAKYQKLGENLYGKLEEMIVNESCYDSGSEGDQNAQTPGSDGNPDDRAYPSSDENSGSEGEEEQDPVVRADPLIQASTTSTVPEEPVVRRRPGRPKGVSNRNTHKKEKLGKVWQFLITLLHNPDYNPSMICWESYGEGKFRFVQSDKVAALWGDTKRNETYNYEKFSRAMRYYYKHDILRSVDGRLIYQFGAHAVGWRTDNPIDPGERVTLSSNTARSARTATEPKQPSEAHRQTGDTHNAVSRQGNHRITSQENHKQIQNSKENHGQMQDSGENHGQMQNSQENHGQMQNSQENHGQMQNSQENHGQMQNSQDNHRMSVEPLSHRPISHQAVSRHPIQEQNRQVEGLRHLLQEVRPIQECPRRPVLPPVLPELTLDPLTNEVMLQNPIPRLLGPQELENWISEEAIFDFSDFRLYE